MGADTPVNHATVQFAERDGRAAIDRALSARILVGDAIAFDEVVARYWTPIFRFVRQLLGNREDAEEVTQDTFIRAHRSVAGFRGEAALSTWLYRIALNTARSRRRYWRVRKRHRSLSLDALINGDTDRTVADGVAAVTESPDAMTVSADYVRRIEDGIHELNAKYREVLILRCVEDRSYSEIAAITGTTLGCVKTRIRRARECLRARIVDSA